MSAKINFNELSMWYKLPNEDENGDAQYAECRKDIIFINYQEKTITAAIDKNIVTDSGEELTITGYIITDSFDKFEASIP